MASSSSSSQSRNYDVFLSFRGDDTRNSFVDHLYSALFQKGIYTYKDDEALPRGESIAPALFNAIERSKIAVVVFSENYADSSWCLKEIAHIMKCKDERGLIVMPVFYYVDPSDVRNRKRKYGEAFAKHVESENNNSVETWRKALADAGSLSGWEPTKMANGHEAKAIEEIVNGILNRLFQSHSNVNEDLVGMRTRVDDLKSKLDIGSGGVRMVGIWGLGGGGKTTLASTIYDEISSEFDVGCFISSIRDASGDYGLEKLQEKLLSRALKNKVEVERVDEGKCLIKRSLGHKNTLLVLDDVDHLDQLDALAGSANWFGDGTRIIITTRDKHLLKAHRVNEIFEITLLNNVEATQLFHKRAFPDHTMIKDYETRSKDVISYACGLPLAVKVLGSFLCGKDKNEWISALARLKDIPDKDIMEKLKISYDGLKADEKEMFLDIACFFNGEDEEKARMILDACGHHSIIVEKVLTQKALLTVRDGEFAMHDLIREMGYRIVRMDYPYNPENHSRLWKKEDVQKLCAMDTTTENDRIEALQWLPGWGDIPHKFPHAIANMKKLRFLSCYGYPAVPLQTTFQPAGLRYLGLQYSMFKQVWEGYKCLPSLEMLDLSFSHNLVETPDISGLLSLERLIFKGCGRLKEIHPSLVCHEGLVFLDMSLCKSLEIFPPIIGMKKLETLVFTACRQLRKFPEIQMNMDRLKHLFLNESGIEVLPSSIGEYCINLESLDLTCCYHLKSIETSFYQLEHLNKLHLTRSKLLDGGIPIDMFDLSNLNSLDMSGNEFSRIGCSFSQLPCLKFLNLSHCSWLVELPDLPSNIAILNASFCDSLEIVRDIPRIYKWLWNVSLSRHNKGGLIDVEKVVQSMLEGNAIDDYFMSLQLGRIDVPTWTYQPGIFRLKLPHNWNDHFTGFLIRFVELKDDFPLIIIKQEIHTHYQYDLLHDETPKTGKIGGMCYMSFGELRRTSWWDSIETPSLISFSIRDHKFKVELVHRRKSRGDSIERASCSTTNGSMFWDHNKTFKVEHDSKSSLEIKWHKFNLQGV